MKFVCVGSFSSAAMTDPPTDETDPVTARRAPFMTEFYRTGQVRTDVLQIPG